MSLAEQLILENLKTKNPYLNLGNCGLDGTEPCLQLLEQCTHLETLVFSDAWFEWKEKTGEWESYQSQNRDVSNKIKRIPSYLPKNLQKFVLSGSLFYILEISDISNISKLINLTYLNLSFNGISDISPIGKLPNLIYLDLSYNQIFDISVLGELPNLKGLYLRNNKIKYFPSEIVLLGKLQNLYLADNPIENIPKEYFDKKNGIFAENVLHEVRDYFQSIANKDETRELNEAKLVIAGVGEVGKSELVEALSTEGYTFVAGRNSTQGIQIRQWQQPCTREGKDFVFCTNIWDLAGQNENYHTHQFFLSKNTVYLFVWNARVNNNEANQFEYWLQAISLLSEKSPILVVQNKIDENRNAETNQENWKEKFPHIVGFYKTSCKTGEGISELRQAIQAQLLALPAPRELWNKNRFAVREALEKETRDYIYTEEYHRICEAHSLRKEEANFLASQLHDIGVMLHYPHNESLRNVVVLKSDWAVAAAYCLIHKEKVQAGRFHKHDLPTIWDSARFEYNRPYLLELMKHFELIFQLQESETYIVPEGLPTEEPKSLTPNPSPRERGLDSLSFGEGKGEAFLRFEYHYDFMPKGILSRLICRVHTYIKGEQFWRYGVELEDKEDNQARIVLNDVSRILKVEVWGDSPSLLLYLIRSHTEAIHQNLKNPPLQEIIPCYCEKCGANRSNTHFFEYSYLKMCVEMNFNELPCKNGSKVSLPKMLQGILDTKKVGKAFLLELLTKGDWATFFAYTKDRQDFEWHSLRNEYLSNRYDHTLIARLQTWVGKTFEGF